MQLKALKVFCDIARFRSFSQAAAAWDLTQSAASQIVHELEKNLAVQLIDRSTRPLQLTPLGQLYFDGCKAILEQYEELEASIRRADDQRTLSVEVAAIYSVGLGDMGQLIDRFKTQYAPSRVHIEYAHPNTVYDKVLGRSAELGLVSFPRKQRELTILAWRDEEMMVGLRAPVIRWPRRYRSSRCNSKGICLRRFHQGFDDPPARRSIPTPAWCDRGDRDGIRHDREHQAGH